MPFLEQEIINRNKVSGLLTNSSSAEAGHNQLIGIVEVETHLERIGMVAEVQLYMERKDLWMKRDYT